jgi:hypothetical protein
MGRMGTIEAAQEFAASAKIRNKVTVHLQPGFTAVFARSLQLSLAVSRIKGVFSPCPRQTAILDRHHI